MQQLFLRRFALAAILAAFPTSIQAVSFEVEIPVLPEPQAPISRVLITLETSANPAGATVSFRGGAAQALETPAHPGQAYDSNRLFFFRVAAENRIHLNLLLKENLLDPTDRCHRDPAGDPENDDVYPSLEFNVTLPVGVTITNHRLTSYAAIRDFNCGCSNRRIDFQPAIWTTAPPGTDLGRHGLDVALVLDESGSMGELVSAADTKMDLLHWSVGQFVNAWKLAGGPTDDRLGVVFFESDVRTADFGGEFWVARGDGSPWDDVTDEVDLAVPLNSTALGDGLQEAIDRHEPPRDHSIVLMTDGLQNTGNLVTENMGLMELNGATLASRCFPIQTIGVGSPADVQANRLDKIAEQTGGKVNLVADPNQMNTAFIESLVQVLKGNTLSLLHRESATLAAGSPASAPRTIEIDSSVPRVVIDLAWREQRFALDLEIIPPGGGPPIEIPKNDRTENPFYTIQAFSLPAAGPIGTWQIRVVRRSNAGSGELPYSLSVLAVEGALKYHIGFTAPDYRAGDPIIVTAQIGNKGIPIVNLDGTMTVDMFGPRVAFGTFMREHQVGDDVLSANPQGIHPDRFPTASSRKLYHLLKTTNLGSQLEGTSPQQLTLTDDGSAEHGDATAGDGIYSARFSDTTTPGYYRFDVAFDAEAQGIGRFKRIEQLETQVSVGRADRKSTEVGVTPLPSEGKFRDFLITIVPADRLGNFFGPDFEDLISVDVTGGGTVQPAQDLRADGTYTVRLTGVPTESDPQVSIDVEGETVAEAPLSLLSGSDRRWSLSLHAGVNDPRGSTANLYDGDTSFGFDLEYALTPHFALEAFFGHDELAARKPPTRDLVTDQISLNGKVYILTGFFQPYILGGYGRYDFNPGPTEYGLSYGAGLRFNIWPTAALELTGRFHQIDTNPDDTEFAVWQAVVRFSP